VAVRRVSEHTPSPLLPPADLLPRSNVSSRPGQRVVDLLGPWLERWRGRQRDPVRGRWLGGPGAVQPQPTGYETHWERLVCMCA
jgi:hypothetical protein